jgi:hypothetical protein
LPSQPFINHRQADRVFDDAIEFLAKIHNISVDELIKKLERCLNNSDIFSFRTAGSAIRHGKINLSQGAKAITAIDGLVKFSANKFILSNKDKRRAVQDYLSNTNLVVPGAGSFIHNIEIDLLPSPDTDDNDLESTNRYVNTRLANLLINIQELTEKDITPSVLIEKGITSTLCKYFIDLFSEDVEEVECDFDWSLLEVKPKIKTNKVLFNRSHKNTMKKVQDSFKGTKDIELTGISAHIENYKTPKDKCPVLVLKLQIEGSERICDAVITDKTMQALMAEISKSEDLNQLVTITATVTKVVENSKPSYHISHLEEISLEKGRTIPLSL